MFRLRPKLEVKLNGAISDVQFKPSLKFNSRTKYQFWRLLHSCAERAHIICKFAQSKLDVFFSRAILAAENKPSSKMCVVILPVCFTEFSQYLRRNNEPLNFVGAFVDGGNLGIAIHLFYRNPFDKA